MTRCAHSLSGPVPLRVVNRLACVLTLALVACGGEQQAAAPTGPDQPVSASGGRATVPGSEPAPARYCRRLGNRLAGARLAAAESRAARRGCTLRVAVRDGRALALTEDFQPGRINVRVRSGVIAGVEFMG